jgi:hypothetical protein
MLPTTETPADNHYIKSTTTQIIMGIVVLCVYGIGVYLHSKIIQISRKEKDMTWKVDIYNSTFFIVHYFHVIVMNGITYMLDDLHEYTGNWFCYVSKSMTIIGNGHTTGHSFIIAMMKYIVIVHYQRFNKDTVKNVFFWLNSFNGTILFAIFNLAQPYFVFLYDGISQSNRCLGKNETTSSLDNNTSAIKLHDICNITESFEHLSFEYVYYIFRKTICWVNIVFIYSNVCNVLEMFVYCRIFSFMHR